MGPHNFLVRCDIHEQCLLRLLHAGARRLPAGVGGDIVPHSLQLRHGQADALQADFQLPGPPLACRKAESLLMRTQQQDRSTARHALQLAQQMHLSFDGLSTQTTIVRQCPIKLCNSRTHNVETDSAVG